MANRWGKSRGSDRLYLLGLQNHCRQWLRHEIRRCLLLGRKAMTNLDSILKSRDVTLLTKCVFKAMVFPVGNQSWIFFGQTDAEAPVLWSPDVKNWLTGKDPEAGKDWRQEKGMTEDEMVGWHHWLNGLNLSKLQETVKAREACCAALHGFAKSWTCLNDWTTMPTTTVTSDSISA